MRKENIVQTLSAPLAPPTKERPYRLDTDQKIPRPYVARASVAPSVEKPNGTASFVEKYRNYVSRYCPLEFITQIDDISSSSVSNAAALHLLGQG